jgi:hypothetical protein
VNERSHQRLLPSLYNIIIDMISAIGAIIMPDVWRLALSSQERHTHKACALHSRVPNIPRRTTVGLDPPCAFSDVPLALFLTDVPKELDKKVCGFTL